MTLTILDNRYQIIRALATGGFGETLLAQDTHMPSGRYCVIKQLKPITNEPQVYQLVKERFQREAAILENLGEGSNQIPRLYAYFPEAAQFYLVQEWIEGATLSQKVLGDGLLNESSVREILINILPVLDYIHSNRIVHRDIKPANIILRSRDTKPVLIDFGAVKETMGTVMTAGGHVAPSIVIGTPGFMASEQSVGRPVYSSDLYSLGLTAIYLLTGKIPQQLETDHSTGEYLWRHHTLNISKSFASVLDKTIQSHPRDRYSTAKEMLNALESSSSPIPPTLAPTLPPSQPTKPSLPTPQPYYQEPPHVQPQNYPLHNHKSGMGDWQKAIIIGSLVGICGTGGWFVIKSKSFAPNPPGITATTTISQQEAINLVNRWLQAKRVMFAPPYDRQTAADLTTGELYERTAGADGSIAWLENNSAYYKYELQRIDSVNKFVANKNDATIEVVVTEERKLYKQDDSIDPQNSATDTTTVRYTLKPDNGKWKIFDYQSVK